MLSRLILRWMKRVLDMRSFIVQVQIRVNFSGSISISRRLDANGKCTLTTYPDWSFRHSSSHITPLSLMNRFLMSNCISKKQPNYFLNYKIRYQYRSQNFATRLKMLLLAILTSLIFILLFLSEGRAMEFWEPCKKPTLIMPHNSVSFISPMTFPI
jgi:hypothetical protein